MDSCRLLCYWKDDIRVAVIICCCIVSRTIIYHNREVTRFSRGLNEMTMIIAFWFVISCFIQMWYIMKCPKDVSELMPESVPSFNASLRHNRECFAALSCTCRSSSTTVLFAPIYNKECCSICTIKEFMLEHRSLEIY